MAAEPVVALGDEQDGMALGAIVEARVRLGFPGEHGIYAQSLRRRIERFDPDLGDPARVSGDRSATASISSASSRPYCVSIVLSG